MILEPLNVNYNEPEVIQAISTALTEFYTALSQKLDKININKILKRKILTYTVPKVSITQLRLSTGFFLLISRPVRKLSLEIHF